MPLVPSTNSGAPPGPRLAAQPMSPANYPNVTTRSPRASPRLTRNDSTASAPADTHHFSPLARSATYDSSNSTRRTPSSSMGSGLRAESFQKAKSSTPNGAPASSSPMFFHASEVKGLRPSKPISKPPTSKPPISSAKFFYAGDSRSGSVSRSHSPESTPITSPPSAPFVPNSTPKLQGVTSANKQPHIKFNRPEEPIRRNQLSPDLRPVSPLQDSSGSSAASTRLLASPMLSTSPPKPSYLSQHTPPVSQRNSYVQPASRRQSVDLTPRRHVRANSVNGYGEPVIKVAGFDGLNGFDHDKRQSPKSPTVPLHVLSNAASIIEHQKELAAAARRERKILDLEISNASLLAINKTFERRIRKQTTEIRRFRRLSRSGLITLHSEKPRKRRSRSGSENDDIDASAEENSDEDSANEEESDVSEEDSSSSESQEEGEAEAGEDGPDKTSTKVPTEKELTRRAKEEKRLAGDIAKHRSLLEASAKMNASLKRCQMVTETLIEEGKKALSHIVRASEVKIAPRVIDPNDDLITEGSEMDSDLHEHFQDDTTDGGYSTPTYQESDADGSHQSRSIYSRSESRSDDLSVSDGLYYESDDLQSLDGGYDPPDVMTPREERVRVFG